MVSGSGFLGAEKLQPIHLDKSLRCVGEGGALSILLLALGEWITKGSCGLGVTQLGRR